KLLRRSQNENRLTQMADQQMQEARHIGEAECRQLVQQTSRFSKKMAGGEHNHYGAKDPQHQEFIFPRHGGPPTSI
ncbi:MAG: hypothetical protein WBE70_01500, partial [Candidatus Acidiferrum sp.]